MEKASPILIKIGIIFGIFLAVFNILFTVLCFLIASPSNIDFIIEGLANGTIRSDLPGTIEEQAHAIQKMFVVFGVAFLLISLVFVASTVFNFLTERVDSDKYRVVAFVFSCITIINITLFLGYLFYYCINNKDSY